MTLDTMKELFGIMHVGEAEVPNTKSMRVGKEEVSHAPVTVVIPMEEEEVPVSQGPFVTVPPEEEEVPTPPPPPIVVPP
jgi:hypothetical protein